MEKITLIGHDWGGIIAWIFSAYYPDRLKKLIILNAPHPAIYQQQLRENPVQQKAAEYVLLLRRKMAAKILAKNNHEWLKMWVLSKALQNGLITIEDQQAYESAWSQPSALEAMLNYYCLPTLNSLEDKRPDWANFVLAPDINVNNIKITHPTLVIWGEKDEALVNDNLNNLSNFVKNLMVKKLPDCSHLLVQEQPDKINQMIEDFLNQ